MSSHTCTHKLLPSLSEDALSSLGRMITVKENIQTITKNLQQQPIT